LGYYIFVCDGFADFIASDGTTRGKWLVGIAFDALHCGHLPMKKIATRFAMISLFSITICFSGPLLGSFDIDGDGVPDVPVMVMHGSNDQNVQTTPNDGPARTDVAMESYFSQSLWIQPVIMHRRVLTVTSLRC